MSKVDAQSPSADFLGDLLGPLAIEGPPSSAAQPQQTIDPGLEGDPNAVDATAIVPVDEQPNAVQVLTTTFLSNLLWTLPFKNVG